MWLLFLLLLPYALFGNASDQAKVWLQEQRVDKAFIYFLEALNEEGKKVIPPLSKEEKKEFDRALSIYLEESLFDSEKTAEKILQEFEVCALQHPHYHHLRLLVSTSYANLKMYEKMFDLFSSSYCFLPAHFLTYKMLGVLNLRLSQMVQSESEREAFQKEGERLLLLALDEREDDPTLYRSLIYLSHAKKEHLAILHYLKKMVKYDVKIKRQDLLFYVEEAKSQGNMELAREVIKKAKKQFGYSRTVIAAEEMLK